MFLLRTFRRTSVVVQDLGETKDRLYPLLLVRCLSGPAAAWNAYSFAVGGAGVAPPETWVNRWL